MSQYAAETLKKPEAYISVNYNYSELLTFNSSFEPAIILTIVSPASRLLQYLENTRPDPLDYSIAWITSTRRPTRSTPRSSSHSSRRSWACLTNVATCELQFINACQFVPPTESLQCQHFHRSGACKHRVSIPEKSIVSRVDSFARPGTNRRRSKRCGSRPAY